VIFLVCLVARATKGIKQMGRCQTETYYRTEASYLKSVLLWLQEYWTGPAVDGIKVSPILAGLISQPLALFADQPVTFDPQEVAFTLLPRIESRAFQRPLTGCVAIAARTYPRQMV